MERLEAKQVTGNTYYYDSRWAKIDGTAYPSHWRRGTGKGIKPTFSA